MFNMLKLFIVRLLGGLNQNSLDAVFKAAGMKQSFSSIKEAAVKNLQSEKELAESKIEDALSRKSSATQANQAELAKALEIYNAAVSTANSRMATVFATEDAAISVATREAKAADDQLKLIG